MNKQFILFSTTNLIGSAAIRVFTWSRFSHVDWILSGTSKIIGATLTDGVAVSSVWDRLDESKRAELYSFSCGADGEAWIKSQEGRPYDWSAIFGLVFRRDWQQDTDWFCSELVARASLEGRNPLINPLNRMNRVTPRDLLLSPLLTLEASGKEACIEMLTNLNQ